MKVGQVSHDFDWDFHTMPWLAGLDDDDYFFSGFIWSVRASSRYFSGGELMSLVAGLLKTGPCLVLMDFFKTNLVTGILKHSSKKLRNVMGSTVLFSHWNFIVYSNNFQNTVVVAQILSLQVKTF